MKIDLSHISELAATTELEDLLSCELEDIQRALNFLGLPSGNVDGDIGPKTRAAWAEFCADYYFGNPKLVTLEAVTKLQQCVSDIHAEYCFDTKDDVIKSIAKCCDRFGLRLNTQKAYVVATAHWETAGTLKPVEEAYWKGKNADAWRKANLRYYPYYGRGYVQLTWYNNYRQYGRILGIDLDKDPNLALDPETSLFILVHGFLTGAFTGRKISDYIKQDKCDFYNARRCINGLDQATKIKSLAESYIEKI